MFKLASTKSHIFWQVSNILVYFWFKIPETF